MRLLAYRILGITLCCLGLFASHAQDMRVFKPMSCYSEDDKEILSRLSENVAEEKSRTTSPREVEINKIYDAFGKRLRNSIMNREWIKDDSLQKLLDHVVIRLVKSNALKFPPKIGALKNDPTVNAFASVGATLVINVGLLARLTNESELAFAVAHEMAHLELQHIRKRIEKYVEDDLYKTQKQNFKELMGDKASAETMEKIRRLVYDVGHFSREMEIEADRMGLEMMENAGYDNAQVPTMLTLLNPVHLDKVDMDFMFQLDVPDYPLKEEWFSKRPTVLSSKRGGNIFINNDSLQSHPDLDFRVEQVLKRINKQSGQTNFLRTEFINYCVFRATCQAVEAASFQERYDWLLYLALKLRKQRPQLSYATTRVTTAFTSLYEIKDYGFAFRSVLPDYTFNYNEELRMVNEFLHNLSKQELAEIAFHFLNGKNFDPSDEAQYYLLWRICTVTNRKEEVDNVKRNYKALFPQGRYLPQMITYRPWTPPKKKPVFR